MDTLWTRDAPILEAIQRKPDGKYHKMKNSPFNRSEKQYCTKAHYCSILIHLGYIPQKTLLLPRR